MLVFHFPSNFKARVAVFFAIISFSFGLRAAEENVCDLLPPEMKVCIVDNLSDVKDLCRLLLTDKKWHVTVWQSQKARIILAKAVARGNRNIEEGLWTQDFIAMINAIKKATQGLQGELTIGSDIATISNLLKQGADANAFSEHSVLSRSNSLLLHEAVEKNSPQLVNVLLIFGASVNAARSSDGYTPLHLAAFKGFGDCVVILLANGADKDMQTSQFKNTAYNLAQSLGHTQIMTLLQDQASSVQSDRVQAEQELDITQSNTSGNSVGNYNQSLLRWLLSKFSLPGSIGAVCCLVIGCFITFR